MGGDVLVLRTIGRRSGKPREAPMFYLPYRDGYAVVASNAAISAGFMEAQSPAVPEPVSVSVLGLLGLALVRRR